MARGDLDDDKLEANAGGEAAVEDEREDSAPLRYRPRFSVERTDAASRARLGSMGTSLWVRRCPFLGGHGERDAMFSKLFDFERTSTEMRVCLGFWEGRVGDAGHKPLLIRKIGRN